MQTATETAEISCELIPKPALYLFEARLPAALIARVNDYIDGLGARAQDYSGSLVGQIRRDPRSAQLSLDLRDKVPADLAGILAEMGRQYIGAVGHRAAVTPIDMWSVHSYSGDYNPLHDHGGKTLLGLASILYLKVPRVIAEKPDIPHGGVTQLIWGATGMRDYSLLRPPTQQYVKPEEGKLLLFPNWLLHRVEPFFGEGERRTLSCNMDVIFDEPNWY
jgi:hypothetical protein